LENKAGNAYESVWKRFFQRNGHFSDTQLTDIDEAHAVEHIPHCRLMELTRLQASWQLGGNEYRASIVRLWIDSP